jgi:hypothetical protein
MTLVTKGIPYQSFDKLQKEKRLWKEEEEGSLWNRKHATST